MRHRTLALSALLSLGLAACGGTKSSDRTVGDSWVYTIDDVMFGVQSKDEALAAELIALFP